METYSNFCQVTDPLCKPPRATLQHIRARYGQQTVGWILVSAGLVLLRILYRWGWIG